MISKFLSFSSSYTFCHPARSKRQPHHDAQVSSNTFLPRKSESRTLLPAQSASSKAGASPASRGEVSGRGTAVKLHTLSVGSTAKAWFTRLAKRVTLKYSTSPCFESHDS